MSEPALDVAVERGIVEVGGTVSGRLRLAGELDDLASDSNQRVRAVRVSLGYTTEGRGDTDARAITELEFPVDQYGGVEATFDLSVPRQGPISYDGRLIRVRWDVEARVDVKLRRDPTTHIPVLVIPSGGWGLYDRPHPLHL